MTPRRALTAGVCLLAGVLLTLAVVYRLALQRVADGLPETLGPRASVEHIAVGWRSVTLRGLRVRGEPGQWPADDELRADEVVLRADLLSFLGGTRRVHSADLDGVYLSVRRDRPNGMQALPALFEQRARRAREGGPPRPATEVATVRLHHAVVELFDTTLRQPHRLRLEAVQGEAGPWALPGLTQPFRVEFAGTLKGVQHDGGVRVTGDVDPPQRSGHLQLRLQGVDLTALQPYVLRFNEGGVRRGTLDLDVDAKVDHNQLKAPGHARLTGLELASAPGLLGSFAGVQREAVLAAMTRDGHIDLQFSVEGRLDDPKFSLQESLALKIGAGLAHALGATLGGVAEGLGQAVKGLLGR